MPVTISTVALTNTWQYLVSRLNDVITQMNTTVLTANSTTTGNTAITGTFTANTVVANTANLTNLSIACLTANTTSIVATANSTVAVTITANTISSTTFTVGTSVASAFQSNTSGTSNQVVDSFSISTYGSAEYVLDVKDNVANNKTHSRISVLNNGGTVFSTEYGMVVSNNSIGTFTVSANSTHGILSYQPATSTSTTIKGLKTLIQA